MTEMPEPAPRALIFDWDNTLIDSWDCLRAAINETLDAFGMAPWSRDDVRRQVARSLREAFPDWFGDRWEEAAAIYKDAFGRRHLDALRPLPGSAVLLEGLAARDLTLGVVSNKSGHFLRAEAAALDWERHFHRLVGAGDAARDKPAPDPVALALLGGLWIPVVVFPDLMQHAAWALPSFHLAEIALAASGAPGDRPMGAHLAAAAAMTAVLALTATLAWLRQR